MLDDILVFSIVKIIERFVKKYRFDAKLFAISQLIIMTGVFCAVMHNYVTAAEIIYFGVRTQWSALLTTR